MSESLLTTYVLVEASKKLKGASTEGGSVMVLLALRYSWGKKMHLLSMAHEGPRASDKFVKPYQRRCQRRTAKVIISVEWNGARPSCGMS